MQQSLHQKFDAIRQWLNAQIVGQHDLVERLLMGLLADGHLLVEGAPGLAKTRAVRLMANCVEGDFHRIQFTPDLLPADLTGTEIFRQQSGTFEFQKGPLFHSIVLADEINRAPAKVQSALLEAMAERQITVGRESYQLPDLFMVMATQNPIEQEGTYPLPEAQLDRFLLHIIVDYPEASSELAILNIARNEALQKGDALISRPQVQINLDELWTIRKEVLQMFMTADVERYIVELVLATRTSSSHNESFSRWLEYGASPRATIALDRCARARAWSQGRDYVSPEDIQHVAPDVLRHRIIRSYEAEAEGVTCDQIIRNLLNTVAVP